MRQEGEPSVEEILESIKKVIARDNRETLQSERRRRDNTGIGSAPPMSAGDDYSDEVLDLDEATELLDGGGLTTHGAARSMRESLEALAMISEPSAPPQIVRSGETSLEGLTRELLKPMLAQWLDHNLPAMVERLVKAEISRIAGKRG
jgi:cell pole-organizing protein PopZ